MVPPRPATQVNEILAQLNRSAISMKMLEDLEYARFKRSATELLRVDREQGLYCLSIIHGLHGDIARFSESVSALIKLPNTEPMLSLFFGYYAALGEIEKGRALLSRIDLDSPLKIVDKFHAFLHDYQIDKAKHFLTFAERLGIQETLGHKMANLLKHDKIKGYMIQRGIGQKEFDLIHNMAAKAAMTHGVLLLKSPELYFDNEEDMFFLQYNLPINIEKSFQIQDSFQEMADDEESFPQGLVAFTIYAEGATHAL